MSINANIGVKRMGELDSKPFHEAMKRKYDENLAYERAIELCTLWEEYLRDPAWHPIKMVDVNGKHQVSFYFVFCNFHPFYLLCVFSFSICLFALSSLSILALSCVVFMTQL